MGNTFEFNPLSKAGFDQVRANVPDGIPSPWDASAGVFPGTTPGTADRWVISVGGTLPAPIGDVEPTDFIIRDGATWTVIHSPSYPFVTDVVYGGTYSDHASPLPRLTDLIAGSLLVPGMYYRITDFQTAHVINGVDEVHRGPLMPIIVEAQTTNTLMPEGTIDNNHTDIISYDRTQEIMPGASTNGSVMFGYTNMAGAFADGMDQGGDFTMAMLTPYSFTINKELLIDGSLQAQFGNMYIGGSLGQADLTPQTYSFQSIYDATAGGHQTGPIITPTGQFTFTVSGLSVAPTVTTFTGMMSSHSIYVSVTGGYTITETAPGSRIWTVEITDTTTYAAFNALDPTFALEFFFDATFAGRAITPSITPGLRDVTINYPFDVTGIGGYIQISGGNVILTTNGTIPITITGTNTFTIPVGIPIDINQYFGMSVNDSVNSYYLTVADLGTGFTYDSMTGLFTILAGPIDLTDVAGYGVDINNTLLLGTRPGWITYRKNIIQDIEATYDYENCVTRLRAIDTATMFPMFVPGTLYTVGQLVTDGSNFYMCIQNTTGVEAPGTNNFWMGVIDASTAAIPMLPNPTGGIYGNINFIADANTWRDYYVLHNISSHQFDKSGTYHFKDLNPSGNGMMTNNVFVGGTGAPQVNNVTMIGGWNFFFKRQYLNLHLENMSANIVPQQGGMINDTALNIAGSIFMGEFNNSNIQQVTSSTILGNGLSSVTVVGGIDNSIISGFDTTVINGLISQCTIGGTTNRNNTIGSLASDMYYSGIEGSTILNSAMNVFNAKAFECTIERPMMQCIVPENLGAAFGNVTTLSELVGVDFTGATHVYLGYSKEIIQRPDATYRLRWLDNTDNINIDLITA